VQRIVFALITVAVLSLAYASGALAADMVIPDSGPAIVLPSMGKAPPPFFPDMGKAPPPLPTKAPLITKAPRVLVPNWTGFYVGGDAGAAWVETPAAWDPLPSPTAFGTFPIFAHDRVAGLIGGPHAGYDYQLMPHWVAGVEGDWMWSSTHGSFTQPWIAEPGFFEAPGAETTMSTRLDWLSSARVRVGYLVTPTLMAYATGGAAWARIDYSASNNNGGGYITSADIGHTAFGYTAGGGLELAITNCWSVRAEYLYYRFGAGPSAIVAAPGFPGFPSAYSWGGASVNVARAGASYKF
jgi:outer membrane immunogenic protein